MVKGGEVEKVSCELIIADEVGMLDMGDTFC